MSDSFFIVARERGLAGRELPTWSDRGAASVNLEPTRPVTRVDVEGVPGAFQLLNVLSPGEAQRFIAAAERLGFHADSPVSLPRSIRHNDNLNWVVSDALLDALWQRSAGSIPETVQGEVARGLNGRFRFYRYGQGDFFKPHTDGAWPGSRVVNETLVTNFDTSLYSQYTYLILLNDDFEGGETEFLVSRDDPERPARTADDVRTISVRTPTGGVLCFPHGMHPQHCVHSSAPITRGIKYIIRTDILFGPKQDMTHDA